MPEALAAADSVEAFLDGLTGRDEEMEGLRSAAEASGEVLRYVAAIRDDGRASVGLRRYPADHPFARIKGTDNILAFRTGRYYAYPSSFRARGRARRSPREACSGSSPPGLLPGRAVMSPRRKAGPGAGASGEARTARRKGKAQVATVAAAFAPATVANVAVGFDVLGFALEGIGDAVTVTPTPWAGAGPAVRVEAVEGDAIAPGSVPLDPDRNTSAVALAAMVDALGLRHGFSVTIRKGIPLSSGMGGSAASAVGAVVAANALLDTALSRDRLLAFALAGEAAASGAPHADNVVPCLYGGLTAVVPGTAAEVTPGRRREGRAVHRGGARRGRRNRAAGGAAPRPPRRLRGGGAAAPGAGYPPGPGRAGGYGAPGAVRGAVGAPGRVRGRVFQRGSGPGGANASGRGGGAPAGGPGAGLSRGARRGPGRGGRWGVRFRGRDPRCSPGWLPRPPPRR